MTITLSQQNYWELVRQTKQAESSFSTCTENDQKKDIIWQYPPQLGHGIVRDIDLREGLELTIADYEVKDDIITSSSDREHPLEYSFNLADSSLSSTQGMPYHFFGNGLSPGGNWTNYAKQPIQWVSVHITPDIFESFIGQPKEELSSTLQHLVRHPDQIYYNRPGQATPAMKFVLQQILQCPYQGLTQRLFLDSKVMELMALILEDEVEAQPSKRATCRLNPEDIERIYYAKEILQANFDVPPSIPQLARQVGLNECTLKQGFRACFNTTIFGYLRQYRLEQAKVLLMEGRMNVQQAAQTVGYASQSRFASVFRKQFGVNPKVFATQYQK